MHLTIQQSNADITRIPHPVISRSKLASLWISSIAYSSLTVNSMATPPPEAANVPKFAVLV